MMCLLDRLDMWEKRLDHFCVCVAQTKPHPADDEPVLELDYKECDELRNLLGAASRQISRKN